MKLLNGIPGGLRSLRSAGALRFFKLLKLSIPANLWNRRGSGALKNFLNSLNSLNCLNLLETRGLRSLRTLSSSGALECLKIREPLLTPSGNRECKEFEDFKKFKNGIEIVRSLRALRSSGALKFLKLLELP